GEAALSGSITTPTGYSVAEAGRSESLITEAGENLKTERNTLSFSVAAGITKTYNLSFAPTAVASYNGNVEVSSNDPANPLVYIAVTGSGYDANTVPTITLPASFTFAENGSLVVDFSAYVDDAETNDSGLSLSYSGNTNVNVDISGLSVTFTATTDWYGTENLSFTVSDGELTASDNVDVIVTQVLAPPAISVDDNTMYAYLQTGSTGTDSFTITNTGEQTLTYSIAIEELRGSFATANSSGRSIDGSTLTLDATDYTPGTTLNWTFTVTNNSTDTEWMQDVIVTFPTGVTVNSATNFVGGDGGDLTPDVTSGNGVTVTWHGEDTSGWGLIYGGGDSATATVNVTIASGFSGDLGLPWTLNGDFYGSEPHTLSGSIVLPSTGNPDPEWYSAAPLSGSIAAGQSETVIVYFSAVDTAVGSYYADLTITSNDPVNPTLVVDLQMDVWDEVLTEPLIAADPASVSGTADAGASTTATLTLSNTGSANLTWSTPASFAAWGTVTPVSGTILPGANTVLTITLDAASLAAGSYSSSLVITSNAANTPSLSVPVSFTVEALPYPANPRFVAEWEPAQGAIVRYPLGQPYSLLADISEETMLYVVVASGSQSTAASALSANGVNMANVAYINASTDSYWIRDYGPWFIFDGGELKVVDFEYNRPRPNDDIIPVTVANYFGLDYYTMDLVATGGNIMCDGHEAAMSTQLIAEENTGYTEAEIEALMEQYLGVTDYQLFTDPNNTYIDHIDCWGKLLDVDKVVIRSVPTNHAQYDEIEATVDEWEAKTSGYGTPYQIFRVYTPNDEPYTNSFILNQNIYVPLMGTANDAAAIAAYQAAMPGYTVTGYTYTNYESTDALHCRINTIFDEQMIHAWHVPPTSATANSSVTLNVEITHSNPLDGGSTYIAYRHSTTGEWLTVPLTLVSGNIWTASVPTPALGQTLYYYILATDTTDRTATLPLCGADDPYEVLVDIPGANTAPTIALPETLEFDMNGSLVVDFSQYVDDVDGDPLTLNYSGNTNVSVSIDGLSVTFTATQDWDGSENLTFTVSDGQENANDTVTVTVNFVNHAPTLTLPVEGFEFYMNATLEVDFSPYIEDLDGHTVTLTVGDSDYIEAAIVGHMVTFSAPTDWFGFETLNFVVDDGYAVGFASVEVRVILNHLAIPDIAISYVDAASDYVKVEWAAIPNANYYQVWASEDPYGTYTFLGETTDAWWYDMDLSHAMRFYKIIASDESYLITK
ncbi:MAG TPA: agmatine deiminase family protein, partial [Candidatus Syntrophosphaera sp.]|nr:agmatine deiminase family protein [Candidatus Syntrophosphaera sp.]